MLSEKRIIIFLLGGCSSQVYNKKIIKCLHFWGQCWFGVSVRPDEVHTIPRRSFSFIPDVCI